MPDLTTRGGSHSRTTTFTPSTSAPDGLLQRARDPAVVVLSLAVPVVLVGSPPGHPAYTPAAWSRERRGRPDGPRVLRRVVPGPRRGAPEAVMITPAGLRRRC